MDGSQSIGSVNTPAHQVLVRELAESAITLLKNEGDLLPLDIQETQSIAVIGPNAFEAVIEGGGSSRVEPPYRVTPVQGIQAVLGDKLEILPAQGCDNYEEPFTVPGGWLKDGLQISAYTEADFSGKPLIEMNVQQPEIWYHTAWSDMPTHPTALKAVGTLAVPEDGLYRFILNHGGDVRLLLDGECLIGSKGAKRFHRAKVQHRLKAGHLYELTLVYNRPVDQNVFAFRLALGRTYEKDQDPRLAQAVEAARNSDIALVFAGVPEAFESEGNDRADIKLPGKQDELIAAVAAANPNTVVVLNVGAPVTMPWVDDVAAIVLAYYPGQENGNAITNVLTGAANPSGKLPITFPKTLEDSPASINASYEGARKVYYGEGIFLGYRYFDERKIEPLFPFGHGLSYTQFEYSDLLVPEKVENDSNFVVQVTIKNTGDVTGKEVIQVYIADPISSLPRPPKELKGFAKVELEPGQSKSLKFEMDQRALSYFDPQKMSWVAEPGTFEVLVGSSSRDIRVRTSFEVA